MLLDDLMPRYDVVERHATIVHAAPEATYAAIAEADLVGGPATRVLLALRWLPAALLAVLRSPRAAAVQLRRRWHDRGRRLSDLEPIGFHVVAERPPNEIVIGVLGRFWTSRGGLCTDVSVAHFAAGPPSGFALSGWNFTVEPREDGHTELRTETRVLCAPDARARFRMYWLVVRPGSGLIRRSMLRAIKRRAERA